MLFQELYTWRNWWVLQLSRHPAQIKRPISHSSLYPQTSREMRHPAPPPPQTFFGREAFPSILPLGEVKLVSYSVFILTVFLTLKNFLYWCIVDLQCCVIFRCTESNAFIYTHISILFQILFHLIYFRIWWVVDKASSDQWSLSEPWKSVMVTCPGVSVTKNVWPFFHSFRTQGYIL